MRRLAAVLLVAACGDDGNVNPLADAPLGADAPPDGPNTGLVTLTVTLDDAPQADIRVYFQNADSSLVSAMTTDANGVASAVMNIGGFVTAIHPFAAAPLPSGAPTDLGDMKTFAGVKPLDNLVLAGSTRGGGSPTQIVFDLLAPVDGMADEYTLYTDCGEHGMNPPGGSGEPPGGPINLIGCGATIDLVIETRSGGTVVNSASLNGVAVANGTPLDLTLTASYATADVTTWEYSNVPSNIEEIRLNGFLATSRGPVVPLPSLTRNPLIAPVSAGNATATLTHGSATDSIQVNVAEMTGINLQSFHTFVEWGPPPLMGTYELTMNNGTLMPDVTNPTFDVGARSVTWTTGGTNTRTPDLAIARTSFVRVNTLWTWEIAAPHGTANAVALPVVPAPDDAINAVTGDEVTVDTLLVGQVPGGYDTIRENALTFANNPTQAAVVGATGTIVLQQHPALAVGITQQQRRVGPKPRVRSTFTRR